MPNRREVTRAAIYCRISKDTEKLGLGVERQRVDCERLASERGWPVATVLVDNDLSAFSGKHRPAYAQLLDRVKTGEVDAVIAWHPDRLYRRVRELEDFVEAVEAAGANVATVQAGSLDLSTPSGRMVARNLGVASQYESEHKAERLRAKHEELAARGMPKGGPRSYGYEKDGMTIIAAEADAIREAAERILRGDSPYAVCTDFNARGVPTTKGGRWRTPTLRGILMSARIAGIREHHGEVIGKATWPAIIDDATRRRLVAIIKDPSRRIGAKPARKYLLSGGLVVCGRCGKPLTSQRRGSGAPGYACVRSPDTDGCGKLTVNAAPLEALVTEAVMIRLDGPELANAVAAPDDSVGPAVEVLESRLEELADVFAAGEVTRAEWLRARNGIDKKLTVARRQMATSTDAFVLDGLVGGVLRKAWPDMSLDRKRAVLAAIVEHVVVKPATRRGPVFDGNRVDVRWRR